MTAVARLDHVSLHVSDLAASAAFYANALDLPEIENKTGRADVRWFGMGPNASLHLIAVAPEPARPASAAAHFALTVSDFDGALARLGRAGVGFCDFRGERGVVAKRADGVRQIYFQDPDGNWVEVCEVG